MFYIVAEILSLAQYLQALEDKKLTRLARCLLCGKAKPWLHGHYLRKADRQGGKLNPIPIQRYYCHYCHKTCSVLPECMAPRRWYLWEVQQLALLAIVAGKSLLAVAKQMLPSRRTLGRWRARFNAQFQLHKAVICTSVIALGRACGFADFWQACLSQMPLSKAMRLCHVAGEVVP